MDWKVSPKNPHVETPNETVFEDRNFKEVIKVNKGHKGGPLVPNKTGI